jgi:endoribonuclease Dicer
LYQLTPGALSDMRSALVNNVTFAVLAVRNGFHRYLKHMVPDIHQAIDRFVQQQELCDHAMPDEVCFKTLMYSTFIINLLFDLIGYSLT